jgi:Ethanolamine utilization protein EutJ (predicted chaperonin)
MNIFRTSASKPSIHIELTESGLDGGVATIGGASTRGGHAVRGGANPAADTATKGKHVVVTVEKAIEIAEGKRKRKRRKPDWKI